MSKRKHKHNKVIKLTQAQNNHKLNQMLNG